VDMSIYSKKSTLTIALVLFVVSGCTNLQSPIEQPVTIEQPEKAEPTLLSATPIASPSILQIKQAQAALKSLGYKVGAVDGIWGKRSKTALLQFEKNHNVTSAGGQLSELNLDTLTRLSPTASRTLIHTDNRKTPASLPSQIDRNKPLSQAPQLIIIEKAYSLMAKANPYSALIRQLKPGTGVYVISQQDNGWYEIQTQENERGFVNAN